MTLCLIDRLVNRYIHHLVEIKCCYEYRQIPFLQDSISKPFEYTPKSGTIGSYDLREFHSVLLGHVPES